MKASSILATIGATPHIRLARMFPDHEVWVKSERANPGGSIKDRIALAMVEDAEARGQRTGVPVFLPSLALSTDNAAMIAAAGLRRFHAGARAGFELRADASLAL